MTYNGNYSIGNTERARATTPVEQTSVDLYQSALDKSFDEAVSTWSANEESCNSLYTSLATPNPESLQTFAHLVDGIRTTETSILWYLPSTMTMKPEGCCRPGTITADGVSLLFWPPESDSSSGSIESIPGITSGFSSDGITL